MTCFDILEATSKFLLKAFVLQTMMLLFACCTKKWLIDLVNFQIKI